MKRYLFFAIVIYFFTTTEVLAVVISGIASDGRGHALLHGGDAKLYRRIFPAGHYECIEKKKINCQSFSFENVETPGVYYVEVEAIGYKTRRSEHGFLSWNEETPEGQNVWLDFEMKFIGIPAMMPIINLLLLE